MTLSVLLIKERDQWVAQALEIDVAAQGSSIDDAMYGLERALVAEAVIQHKEGKSIGDLPSAPQEIWSVWDKAMQVVEPRRVPFRQEAGLAPPMPFDRREVRVS